MPDAGAGGPRDTRVVTALTTIEPLFADRRHARRVLARLLERDGLGVAVVVGLARGGVVYGAFEPVDDDQVRRLLAEAAAREPGR